MGTFDRLSLSSCKVMCLCGKYYANVSFVKPVALFLLLLMMAVTTCVYLFLIHLSRGDPVHLVYRTGC